jgi:hypothetical protein
VYLYGVPERHRAATIREPGQGVASGPYNTALAVTLSAGYYKIIVSPYSDCDWNMTILSRGQTVPAIEIVGAQSYLHSGTDFTPTTTVHMDQSYDFSVFYRVVGGAKGKPAGTITLQEHTGPPPSPPAWLSRKISMASSRWRSMWCFRKSCTTYRVLPWRSSRSPSASSR